jgi:hypothetical protein
MGRNRFLVTVHSCRFLCCIVSMHVSFNLIPSISANGSNLVSNSPVSSYWNPFDPTRKCVDEKVFLLAAAAINIICDVFVFVLPLPWLAKLQMPRKQRYGVIVLFGLGLMFVLPPLRVRLCTNNSSVCVAGTLRIWYITVYFGSYDIFYNGAVLSALAVVECDVGIICGSLPTIRQLVAQVFPKVLDTSKDNTSHVPGSQSFPFQNLERKNEVHTSIVGGQQDNTSEESILRAGIGRRDDIEVRYSTYT